MKEGNIWTINCDEFLNNIQRCIIDKESIEFIALEKDDILKVSFKSGSILSLGGVESKSTFKTLWNSFSAKEKK